MVGSSRGQQQAEPTVAAFSRFRVSVGGGYQNLSLAVTDCH
jgi:hypothetical protein